MRILIKEVCVLAVFIAIAVLAAFIIPSRMLVNTSMTAAGDVAQQLLTQSGGADRVCKEADQIFQQFGITNQTFFLNNILSNYPAITALGKVDYIMPDTQAYIKIRVGNHLNGYIIQIVDTNGNYKFKRGRDTLEVVKDRIFISR